MRALSGVALLIVGLILLALFVSGQMKGVVDAITKAVKGEPVPVPFLNAFPKGPVAGRAGRAPGGLTRPGSPDL